MSNNYLRAIIFTILAFAIGISCSRKPSKEQLNKQIVKYESALKAKSGPGNLSDSGEGVAKQLLTTYLKFVRNYPKDDKAPSYLFNAAMLEAETFHKYQDCIDKLEILRKDYPEGAYAEKSLFLIGYTYAEKMKDYTRAKAVFHQFLEKYPKSTFVPSVKFELKFMGKSPNEILSKKSSNKS